MKWKRVKYIIIISLLNLYALYCQNATSCVEMFKNQTTSVPCVSNSSCCFIQFSYYNTTEKKCLLKKNATDNYCKNLEGPISYFYGSLDLCDCVAGFLKNNWFIFLFLICMNIF